MTDAHTLDAARKVLPRVLGACIEEATRDTIQFFVSPAGAGKTYAAMQVCTDAQKRGQGVCMAFPSRLLRDEVAAAWTSRSRDCNWGLGDPFVVMSVAEKCGIGERFNTLVAAGYTEHRAESLHGAVCTDGPDCRYRHHVGAIATAVKSHRPLLCTHAWLVSPLAQELLSEYGYVVIVDEAHELIRQDKIRPATLQPYLGTGDTEWDDWAAPSGLLAALLIAAIKANAAAGRKEALAQHAAAQAGGRHWRPRPFALADADLESWLLTRTDSTKLSEAVEMAAEVLAPPPPPVSFVDPVHDAWLPRVAVHLRGLLEGKEPEEVGAALTSRVETRVAADGSLQTASYIVWTRWGSLLGAYPLVLMDATGRLSAAAVRAAYPEREVKLHEVRVRMPGGAAGLHAFAVPTTSLRTVNIRSRSGRLSRRGQGAVRHVLLKALRVASPLLARPPRVGFIGPQYVVRSLDSVPLERSKPRGTKLVEHLVDTGQIESLQCEYFGNLRGTNRLEGCDLLVLFGDPIPNLADVADAAAVLGVSDLGLLREIASQEAIQAVGRGRPLQTSPNRPLVLFRAGRGQEGDAGEEHGARAAERDRSTQIQWRPVAAEPHRPRSEQRLHVDELAAELLQVGPASPLIARTVLDALSSCASEEDWSVMPEAVVALIAERDAGVSNTSLGQKRGPGVFQEAAEQMGAAATAVKLTPGRGRSTLVWSISAEECSTWATECASDGLHVGARDLAERLLRRWRGISPGSVYQESFDTHFEEKKTSPSGTDERRSQESKASASSRDDGAEATRFAAAELNQLETDQALDDLIDSLTIEGLAAAFAQDSDVEMLGGEAEAGPGSHEPPTADAGPAQHLNDEARHPATGQEHGLKKEETTQ